MWALCNANTQSRILVGAEMYVSVLYLNNPIIVMEAVLPLGGDTSQSTGDHRP